MGKLLCNHCKNTYSIHGKNKGELAAEIEMKKLDGKYYCKICRQNMCALMMDDVFIIKKYKEITTIDEPRTLIEKILNACRNKITLHSWEKDYKG